MALKLCVNKLYVNGLFVKYKKFNYFNEQITSWGQTQTIFFYEEGENIIIRKKPLVIVCET